MPLLDASGTYVADPFERRADAANRLVPLADLEASQTGAERLGIEIANASDPEALVPHLSRLGLIAIAFPGYADGRGFSLARRLRRLGFTGTLRAVGPLIADQFAYALACGFDELELPEASAARQPAEHWARAARAFSATYPRGFPRGANILDQRRAAREGGRNA
jgi:uncharacterized protein (DUF934 family)